MKKQRKPKSQSTKRQRTATPLPLDTSRIPRPSTTKSAATPLRRPAIRRAPPQSPYRAVTSALSAAWQRLITMDRADRADAVMLALPVVLVALTIGAARYTQSAGPAELTGLSPGARHALIGLPASATPVVVLSPDKPNLTAVTLETPPLSKAITAVGQSTDVQPSPTTTVATAPEFGRAAEIRPLADPVATTPVRPAPATPSPKPSESPGVDVPADVIPPVSARTAQVAALLPPATAVTPRKPDVTAPVSELADGPEDVQSVLTQCRFERAPTRTPRPVSWTPADPESFGLALAASARRQLQSFVIYNDRYTRLKYPMGDVHPMYGVCTDVIIRAYRDLGIDLQELVQTTKTGSGDPNIDHRRVDTLRKFFSRFGESLPISSFAEDYKPGDIVSYWRPQNRHSRTHIAVVSDQTGPSGRPLIIHNRGWGPQQEDGLFVDAITGHYRFSGLRPRRDPPSAVSPNRLKPAREARSTTTLGKPILNTGMTTGSSQTPPAPR